MWPVLICAGFFLGMGALALAAPNRVVRFFDIAPLSVAGRNEVRAVYGGFGVAIAALLVFSLGNAEAGPGIRLTVLCALLGMAAGRLCAGLMDRQWRFYPGLFMALELLLAGWLWLAP